MDKNLRIHTNIASDTILNVNMQQDYDFLEVLSIKLRQKDAYKLHSSNYGVIIGRVLANDAFGIPNAKIAVFIPRDNDDASDLESIYPYAEITSKDKEGRRYNLLPDYSDDECYRIVGTFPNKRLMLDNDSYLEVYDKYWKYSTVTNNAGDYMIFGVPTGNQQIHVDIDLSDIGILSQKPRDFEYKGYNLTMFDNPNQFKESTNLDSLAQLFSQNKSVFVYPFWGDDDNGVAVITRADIQIQYKFEPTCVFMGSIVSDNEGNAIGHKCAAEVDNGMNNQLIAGQGTIEMIRKTTDGLVEEYQIQGNQLIDEDGVWCYQIPMNLDFVGTDEYGNIVPTDNPNRGIPTRTQVRFRISKIETGDEGFSRHTAKYLVPMNPIFAEHNVNVDGKATNGVVPVVELKGQDVEKMYNFGSSTPQSCFRDLYWNNVYSVKNYIPKVQVAHRPYSKNYSALKGSNLAEDQNPIPYNKLRVDIPFMYMIVCILFTVVMWIVSLINLMICMIDKIFAIFNKIHDIKIPVIRVRPFRWIPSIPYIGCISLGGGLSEDNTAYYPGCDCKEGLNAASCPEDMEGNCKKRASKGALMDLVQQRLAEDYKIIKLDLYQDWINGCLYMPLWYWRKRKKKTFLFGLFTSRAKNEFCDCNRRYSRLKTYVTCNVEYKGNSLEVDDNTLKESEGDWHRSKGRANQVRYRQGIIKGVENKDGLTAYYYAALQATSDNSDPDLSMELRTTPFYAIRLYATDIILLGNLDENNLYGIPQFFKALPSTTANIPPIATIYESENPDDDSDYSKNEVAGGEDSGTSVTTGMDWGRDGGDNTPAYKDGLFMDLSCTYAKTKAKSCFNVERISEFGVSLDMSHTISYSNSASNIESGPVDSDGFITKYELDDMENRAMFATMNHIGFVPQDYQDSISGYTTQVEDANTNYLVPKFKYIYPVDFDGRMQLLMDRYKGGFEQSMFDERDESYLTFRFGAEKYSVENETTHRNYEVKRLRHFYYAGKSYEMPVYNNSYYFYFGVNKGSTAIDKFNKLFYSECFQNDKKPFTLDVSYHARTYCPEKYKNTDVCREFAYGYIRVTSDDIRVPFSYTLYDAIGSVVISETDMYETDFVIGGTIDPSDGEVIVNEHGAVKTQKEPYTEVTLEPYHTSGLTNQEYILEVRDSDGKTMSEKVKIDMDKIRFEYQSIKLGTKFYNTEATRIDYICNSINNFYGIIRLTKFYIDTYEYEIDGAEISTYDDNDNPNDAYFCRITGTPVSQEVKDCLSSEDKSVVVTFKLTVMDNDNNVRQCLCDKNNGILGNEQMNIDGANPSFYFKGDAIYKDAADVEHTVVEFYIYQPKSFVGTIYEMCNGQISADNYSSEIIKVNNGNNFNTYLNTMPTRFIIGTVNDSSDATIANDANSNFYSKTVITDPNLAKLNGWFGVNRENTYRFSNPASNQTLIRNQKIWSDFLTLNDSIELAETKKNILRYKFDKMFRVSEATYVTTNSDSTFRYTYTGGVEPVLSRSVIPYYTKYNFILTNTLYSDNNYATVVTDYPNVVGFNYNDTDTDEIDWFGNGNPRLNRLYTNSNYIRDHMGNYFAAFTKNGRYTSTTEVDCNINIMALPSYAPVNPNGDVKRIGREVMLNKYPTPVHTKSTDCGKTSLPYLRAMFIDRRLDYNMVILAPALGESLDLYGNIDSWKKSRISGFTYNGIEMSYDEEYNIISATDNDDNSATANNVLEYSYSCETADSDAITIFNEYPTTLRRFYEAYINNTDIRNYFWSDYNNNITDGQPTKVIDGLTLYLHTQADGFNGNFSKDNYPTRRIIDVGDIPQYKEYYFNVTSCSYGMSPELTEDYLIKSYTQGGENIEYTINFEDPINFIPANEENIDFANLVFNRKSPQSGTEYAVFTADTKHLEIMFSYNKVASNDFEVYTETPQIIQVLGDKVNNIDGISYYKRTPRTETVESRINTIALYRYFLTTRRFLFGSYGDIQVPDGVELSGTYFRKDGDLLPSDDNDFANIVFSKAIFGEGSIGLGNSKVFTILVRRLYVSSDDDRLIKKIRTYETSSLYDLRDVQLRVSQNADDTYVEVKSLNVNVDVQIDSFEMVDPNNPGTVDPDTGEINLNTTEEHPDASNSSGDGKTYYQTITFDMKVDMGTVANPNNRLNQSISDYNVNGYIFKFTNSNDDSYYLNPESITPPSTTNDYVKFKVKWTQDMGILADKEWSNGALVTLFIKMSSNFVYKLDRFRLKAVSAQTDQEGQYNPETRESTMVEYDGNVRKKYKTTTNIN